MKSELIIIGDELLSGRISDLNGPWLAKYFQEKGIQLNTISVISDDLDEIQMNLKAALNRSNIVIVTGGLGPTKDDKTKIALANYFGVEIKSNDDAAELALKHYKRINRDWNKQTNDYHMIPEGILPVENHNGLAPGLMYEEDKKILVCCPGVPKEFQKMISHEIFPIIITKFMSDLNIKKQLAIRTFSIPEEEIFFKLCPNLWTDLEKFGKVSSLPQITGVNIIVQLSNTNDEQKLINFIRSTPLNKHIWQIGDKLLTELIIEEASKKDITIGVAESCTGGLISSMLTDISGSSKVFMGSAITYSNELKSKIVSVKEKSIKDHGAVSKEVALEMAVGLRESFNVDIALSTSGIAGPDGGTKDKPVGTVAIGIASKNKSVSKIYNFRGDRLKLKERFATKALMTLLLEIRNW